MKLKKRITIQCRRCNEKTILGFYSNRKEIERDIEVGFAGCSDCSRRGIFHTDFTVYHGKTPLFVQTERSLILLMPTAKRTESLSESVAIGTLGVGTA